MSKQVELEQLDRAIKDANVRTNTVKMNIEILDREINTLEQAEVALEENIQVLKQQKIVAMADQYKKAKEELKKVRTRLIASKNERENYRKSLDNTNQVIRDSLAAIDKIKKDGDNNVLHAKFGKKDNG